MSARADIHMRGPLGPRPPGRFGRSLCFLLCCGWLVGLALLPLGCLGGHLLLPPQRLVHGDDRPIPDRPRERDPSLVNEILEMSFGYQLLQVLDTPRAVRKLTGRPYQAVNVDNFDEVPNSSWFTNRNRSRPMSPEAIRRGPNQLSGPDTTGPWTVVKLKSAGVTPGMIIVDARGDRYIVKFDPPNYPELPSGSDVVGARLFHAAGYNVPENYIAYLDPARLVARPKATVEAGTRDKRNPISKRPLTAADFAPILERANPRGAPRIRVLASRFLPGIPVGPWRYTGVREGDPNDVYPHEHRREIRGLYVVASWINHADMKEENTLDMFAPEARLVRHYLIDFGAAMGSNSANPSNPRRGQANSLDVKDCFTRLATLGFYVHGYEKAARYVPYPSVGYLENDLFRPDQWKPMYPCPAFENVTRRDAFWGTRIVTSFTDGQIEAAVSTGEFSDPEAAAYLARFLRERRDAIGRYWFDRVNALDGFAATGADVLRFLDLAVDRGYADAAQTRYDFAVRSPQGDHLARGALDVPELALAPDWQRHDHIVVSLVPQRPNGEAEPVLVYLRPAREGWTVVGLRRLD